MITNAIRNEMLKDFAKIDAENDWQSQMTPYHIVIAMCNMVKDGEKFIVMFDASFVETLFHKYNIPGKDITFVADREFEAQMIGMLYPGVRSIVFERKKLYNYIDNGSFSNAFVRRLNVPKTDKLVILGNPPYQENNEDNKRDSPIYHLFIDACIALQPKYLSMIVPTRWMHRGTGLDDFRNHMLQDKHIKIIKTFQGTSDVFKNVALAGGVHYFLWEKDYVGNCEVDGCLRDLNKYDIVVLDNKSLSILEKINLNKCMNGVVSSLVPFGIRTKYANWIDDGIKCYASYGKTGFVSIKDIKDQTGCLEKWKVCITKATSARSVADKNGKKSIITDYLLLQPNEVCTDTYLVISSFESRDQAENFISYMQTKIFRFLMSLRLLSYNTSKDSFAFVPDLGIYDSPWDDKRVCEHLAITEAEWNHVNSKIKDWQESED